jgi:mono/diheme cytochrome c family protein
MKIKPILLLALSSAALAATASRSIWDGVFSAEQVARGKKSYLAECADCHGEKLEGIDKAPALTGPTFVKNWTGKSVFKLIDQTRRTMPPDDPATYSRELCTDVVTYLLSENGYPIGKADLAANAPDLRQIVLEPKR